MRVNVDSAALVEPRIQRMARHLTRTVAREVSRHEVMGRILCVWMLCYERRSPVVEAEDIDIAAELDGFSEAMIASSMAEPEPEGGIYVRGVTERIEFLEKQSQKGKRSAEARAQRMGKRVLEPVQQHMFNRGSMGGSTEPEPGLNSGGKLVATYSLALAPDQALALDQDHPPRDGQDQPGRTPVRQKQQGNPSATPTAEPGKGPNVAPEPAGELVEPAKAAPPEALTLAHLLLAQICTNHPEGRLAKAPERTHAATAERWARTLDKLQRLDGMMWGEIEGMIVWCQRDSFWRGVILGADNLRDKWDTMSAQRNRRDTKPLNGPNARSFDDVLDDAARNLNAKDKT